MVKIVSGNQRCINCDNLILWGYQHTPCKKCGEEMCGNCLLVKVDVCSGCNPMKKKSLNKTLKKYVVEYGGVKYLKHPYISQSYHPEYNRYYNKLYKTKTLLFKECVEKKDWKNLIWYVFENPFKLNGFMKIKKYLNGSEYWEILKLTYQETEYPFEDIDKELVSKLQTTIKNLKEKEVSQQT